MKQILSIILVSALVLSATANIDSALQILSGFTEAMNYADLNPSLENCSISINNTRTSALSAALAYESGNGDVLEQSVALFGYNFVHSFRVCSKAANSFKDFFGSLNIQVQNINRQELSNRLFANVFALNQKGVQVKSSLMQGDFKTAGRLIADMFRVLINNTSTETPRTVRQLGQITSLVDPQVLVDLNAAVIGVLGFIEEANTTIAINDYLTLVNDTTFLANQFPILEKAIESFDFQTIVSTVTAISKYVFIIGNDAAIVKNQTIAFVKRDLPLFTDETKLVKAVEGLFFDLPTTLNNIQRIVNSYNKADYRELGHGAGGVYNQLRNGAMKP